LTFNGIPDEIKGIRPLVWRVLLNHLPRDTSEWERHLDHSRDTYELWKQELIIKPSMKAEEEEKASLKKVVGDHPLSV
jgi:hypothetical protein